MSTYYTTEYISHCIHKLISLCRLSKICDLNIAIYSRPPNTATLRTPQYRRSRVWRKNGGIGKQRLRDSYITKKKHIRDLKIGTVLGRWALLGRLY